MAVSLAEMSVPRRMEAQSNASLEENAMRTKRMWFVRGLSMVAALVAVNACGDSVGPPSASSTARDLDFAVPTAKGRPQVVTAQPGEWLQAPSEALPPGFAEVGGTEGSLAAVIFSKYVSAYWEGSIFHFQYGMFGVGSGYSMRPTIQITGPDFRVILSAAGQGREEHIPLIPWYFRPTMHEQVSTGLECGGSGTVSVKFSTVLDIAVKNSPISGAAEVSDMASSPQGTCQVSGGGGGGGDGGRVPGLRITTCHYEIWFDMDGNVIAFFELGCSSVFIPYTS